MSPIAYARKQLKASPQRRVLLLSPGTKMPYSTFSKWPGMSTEAFAAAIETVSHRKGAGSSNRGLILDGLVLVDWDRLHDLQYVNAAANMVPAETPGEYADGVVIRGRLQQEHGILDTVSYSTRNGGIGDLFLLDDRTRLLKTSTQSIKWEGKIAKIDVKMGNQYGVIPPSKVPADNSLGTGYYEWVRDMETHPVKPMPDWLFKFLYSGQRRKKISGEPEDLERSRRIIEWCADNLPVEYADNRDKWIRFVCCCAGRINAGGDYDVFKELLMKFARRSDKFDEDENDRLLDSFVGSDVYVTVGTLIKWARDSVPREFARLSLNAQQPVPNQIEIEGRPETFSIFYGWVVNDRRVLTTEECMSWIPHICIKVSFPMKYSLLGSTGWILFDPGALRRTYGHDKITVGNKKMKLIAVLDLYSRKCEEITMEPGRDGGRFFNPRGGFLFTYIPGIAETDPDIQRIRRHTWEVVSRCDPEVYTFVLSFIGATLLRTKLKKAIIAGGKQGSGKSALWDDLLHKMLIGTHYTVAMRTFDDIAGRFNSHSENKYYYLADDLSERGSINDKIFSVMKQIITNDTILCEGKGQEARMMSNAGNVVGIANHRFCVPIEESDRRYVCLKADPKYTGQLREYFDPLYDEIRNRVSADKFGSLCVDTFRANPDPPCTPSKWKIRMRIASCPTIQWLRQQCVDINGMVRKEEVKTLYERYREYMERTKLPGTYNEDKFYKETSKLLPKKKAGVHRRIRVTLSKESLYNNIRAQLQ